MKTAKNHSHHTKPPGPKMPMQQLSKCSAGGRGMKSRPDLSEAMLALNSLPDSIKGCLLEAARLCGSTADIAQRNVLHQWYLKVLPPFL